MPRLDHVIRLGVKEFWSLLRDPMMLLLILYTFTGSVYVAATARPETLHRAAIAIVDQDDSPLSARIVSAFTPPQFTWPAMIPADAIDAGLDTGAYTFVLNIPPGYQRDLLAGRNVAMQLNVDATRMSQAFTGSTYIEQIAAGEVRGYLQRHESKPVLPVALEMRARFNPALTESWFGGLMEMINNVTLLSVILTGAALIREREHGTVEHLLVMPVSPAEIMLSKVWSMGVVVLAAVALCLVLVIHGALRVPLEGSVALFLLATALHLFATTSMGIFLATVARSMPQLGMLLILVLLPLQMLSGAVTPRESMPQLVQWLMELAPTTHYVAVSHAILFRGAGLKMLWPPLVALLVIGSVLFAVALRRFRRMISQMA